MGAENAARYLCAVVLRIVLEWTIPRLPTIATNAASPPQIPHFKSRNGTSWPQSELKTSVDVFVGPSESL